MRRSLAERVRPLAPADSASVGTDDLAAAIGRARALRLRAQGEVRSVFDHAILRLEQLADALELSSTQPPTTLPSGD